DSTICVVSVSVLSISAARCILEASEDVGEGGRFSCWGSQISNVWGEIAENGSLNIKQIKRNYNGSFTVDAYDEFGSLLLKATTILCVYGKKLYSYFDLLKLYFTVFFSISVILVYDDECLISYNLSDFIKTENGKYQCTVSNPAHNDTSKEITTDCSTNESDKLFGFDFWVMLALLAGGGGLVILLIILLITCAWQRCKQQEKRQQGKLSL
uniref:Ig-like domain-containing protein n=1 Tax=Electrophorus electricus TaxID=8005 RepID=A0AAY5EK78_ELEEL